MSSDAQLTLTPPPPGPFNRSGLLRDMAITLSSMALIAVILRILAVVRLGRRLAVDDYLLIVSMLTSLTICSLVAVGGSRGVFGLKDCFLTIPQIIEGSKYLLIVQCGYTLSISFTKTSIAVLGLRLFNRKLFTKIIWVSIFTTFCVSAYTFWTLLFQCSPMVKAWDFRVAGTCTTPTKAVIVVYIFSGVHLIFDFLYCGLGVAFIWDLRMSKQTKWEYTIVMSLSLLSSIATMGRFYFLRRILAPNDVLWHFTGIIAWSILEVNFSIITAAVLKLRPLMRSVSSGIQDVKSNFSKGYRHTRSRARQLVRKCNPGKADIEAGNDRKAAETRAAFSEKYGLLAAPAKFTYNLDFKHVVSHPPQSIAEAPAIKKPAPAKLPRTPRLGSQAPPVTFSTTRSAGGWECEDRHSIDGDVNSPFWSTNVTTTISSDASRPSTLARRGSNLKYVLGIHRGTSYGSSGTGQEVGMTSHNGSSRKFHLSRGSSKRHDSVGSSMFSPFSSANRRISVHSAYTDITAKDIVDDVDTASTSTAAEELPVSPHLPSSLKRSGESQRPLSGHIRRVSWKDAPSPGVESINTLGTNSLSSGSQAPSLSYSGKTASSHRRNSASCSSAGMNTLYSLSPVQSEEKLDIHHENADADVVEVPEDEDPISKSLRPGLRTAIVGGNGGGSKDRFDYGMTDSPRSIFPSTFMGQSVIHTTTDIVVLSRRKESLMAEMATQHQNQKTSK